MRELVIDTPRKLLPALEPARYIALYGGRGGAKSHFFAEKLIERAMLKRTRWACIREVQGSLRESVRQLLIDKIIKFGLESEFEVLDSEIRCPHDGLIIFKGMQSFNATNLKSLEDYDGAWVEEAQTLSDVSLRMLRPTIRKEGSEIWFSWNPRWETDPVDHFFRGNNPNAKGTWAPPRNSIIINVNWYDNPWFNETMRQEMEDDYKNDPEMAEHVWGGDYERVSSGAYYAKHISALEKAGRVGSFPYSTAYGPVYTGWDLGVDDYTAIWFFQVHHIEKTPRIRVIDYFESQDIGPQEIIPAALPEYTQDIDKRVDAMIEIGRAEKYKYQRHFFPHDIKQREWGAGGRERVLSVLEQGLKIEEINIGVATNPENRINATREILPMCEFDNNPRVMLGLSRLRRYTKKFNENLGIYLGPLKDGNDHGADAFGEFAINCGIKAPKEVVGEKPIYEIEDGYMLAKPLPVKKRR